MNIASAPSFDRHVVPVGGIRQNVAAFLGVVATAALLISCSDATAPTGEKLSICHISGTTGSLAEIRASALPEHRSHGDYVARLVVDKQSSAIGDSVHFSRIGDAIASARAIRIARNETTTASCRITIAVAPGVFQGSIKESSDPAFERLPLVLDVPDLTLLGSFVMPVDQKGRAMGTGSSTIPTTTLVASPGLISILGMGNVLLKQAEALVVVNAHPNGPRGDGVVIEGFVFQSGNAGASALLGGQAVFGMRAQRLVIRGNQFESNFTESLELRAMTATLDRNYVKGLGGSCGFCLFGPGDYQVINNRDVGPGGIPGILIWPAILLAVPPMVEQYVLPTSALVTATVKNNEIRNHQATPVGVGLRIAAIGLGAPDVIGSVRVVAQDNDLVNNRFGLIVEAGFPVVNTMLRGDIDISLKGNTMTGSCQNSMLVSLSRHTTALGLQPGPLLKTSSYLVALGGDIAWQDVWYSHPAGAGNTLTVDGQTIANGSRVVYDAARVCPLT